MGFLNTLKTIIRLTFCLKQGKNEIKHNAVIKHLRLKIWRSLQDVKSLAASARSTVHFLSAIIPFLPFIVYCSRCRLFCCCDSLVRISVFVVFVFLLLSLLTVLSLLLLSVVGRLWILLLSLLFCSLRFLPRHQYIASDVKIARAKPYVFSIKRSLQVTAQAEPLLFLVLSNSF